MKQSRSTPGIRSDEKDMAISVTGHRGPQDSVMSKLQYFLDSRFTDGGEVVSLTRMSLFIFRQIPGTHFFQRLSWHQGHSAAESFLDMQF
jgi:hypothetical protein